MPDMPEEAKQEEKGHHGGHYLIPAGALIGLGAGMLAGQAGAGVLIGLGLGFVGSAIYSAMASGKATFGSAWIPGIVGIFLILIGLGAGTPVDEHHRGVPHSHRDRVHRPGHRPPDDVTMTGRVLVAYTTRKGSQAADWQRRDPRPQTC